MSELEPGKPGGPDGPPIVPAGGAGAARPGSSPSGSLPLGSSAAPGDPDAPAEEKTPDELAADEREKRRRLVAARLIVAGVGLTFLIVGFVDFISKSH